MMGFVDFRIQQLIEVEINKIITIIINENDKNMKQYLKIQCKNEENFDQNKLKRSQYFCKLFLIVSLDLKGSLIFNSIMCT